VAEELLEERVKKLEKVVESLAEVPTRLTGLGDRVEGLADRVTNVGLQIVQLRMDMRGGFAAVLEVIDSSSKATQKLYDDGQRRANSQLEDVKKEIVVTLGTEMRVLHEALIDRIKLLGST